MLASRVAYTEDLFSSLNGVAASDVAVIALPSNTRLLGKPIHVLHLATSSPAAAPPSSPRLLVVAQAGAEVELVEEYVDVYAGDRTAGASAVNAVTELVVAEGAEVQHCVVQDAGRSSVCLKYSHVAQVGGRVQKGFSKGK